MHTVAVSGSELDVADSAIGPKNQQLSVVVAAGRLGGLDVHRSRQGGCSGSTGYLQDVGSAQM